MIEGIPANSEAVSYDRNAECSVTSVGSRLLEVERDPGEWCAANFS